MKLSPKARLKIIFWCITAPVVPIVLLMLMGAITLSLIPPLRIGALNTVENVIRKFAIWRNNLPVVKNAYDKAHLFDYIKDSSG